MAGPQVSVCAIYPASAVILVAYIFGVRLVSAAREPPMWKPRRTTSTRIDEVEEDTSGGSSLTGLWLRFFLLAVITGVAGYVVAESGGSISEQTGLSESVVGGLFTAVSTSLPELVTSVAAVQQGALTLAVGGIIGGNSFDVMFVAFADIAYRERFHCSCPNPVSDFRTRVSYADDRRSFIRVIAARKERNWKYWLQEFTGATPLWRWVFAVVFRCLIAKALGRSGVA